MNRDDLMCQSLENLSVNPPTYNVEEYETIISALAKSDSDVNEQLLYNALGLAEEAGEVVGKIKKTFRVADVAELLKLVPRDAILKELGDTLFYLVRLIKLFDSSLDEVAMINLQKIIDRRARGVLIGEGDDR
jgi:NTP pyrophosphatase (non-canonical NTP hydrolase)